MDENCGKFICLQIACYHIFINTSSFISLYLCKSTKIKHICTHVNVQIVCSVVFSGFDNNGVKAGPRSTRLSNPEEHVTHYFNNYSKDMLVQVM